MTRYLLDTNMVSELRKPRPHGGVVEWLNQLREDQIFLSAVTLGELQRGVEQTRKQDPKKAHAIEIWVDQLESTQSVLPMDGACFRNWAKLMESTPVELFEDALIAATARVHGLTVATRNTSDFAALGVSFVNPFRPGI
jgi:toxin FitB